MTETSIGGAIIQITHHVSLRGLDRDVDGVRAAEGQVLAHPFLHMRQQLLQKQQGSEVTWKTANEKKKIKRPEYMSHYPSSVRVLNWCYWLITTQCSLFLSVSYR